MELSHQRDHENSFPSSDIFRPAKNGFSNFFCYILGYGPAFGPVDFRDVDREGWAVLPIREQTAYVVGGLYAKTDNCEVHLGATLEKGRKKVIVKRIFKEKSAQPFQTHVNEVRCLLRLQHDRIVKLLGVFDSWDFLDIILEYCPSGALRVYVARSCEGKKLLQILADVAEALTFMHGEWFAHLDIKPHNILVEEQGMDPWSATVHETDIGQSGRPTIHRESVDCIEPIYWFF